jgi:hypothetical protein
VFDEFSFGTSETLCPGMKRMQPYKTSTTVRTVSDPCGDTMAADLGNWMQLPKPPSEPPKKLSKHSHEHAEASMASSSTWKGKGHGGKGKSLTQNKLCKAAVNLDNRLRIVEGILGDAVETPDDLPEVQAAVAAGPAYHELVLAKGRGHGVGPPHLWGWSEFLRALKGVPGLPLDLAYALAEHASKFPDHVAVAQVVKHFTAKHHHDRATIVITVSVSEKIAELGFSIKKFLMTRGAQQHIGPPPRGPIFRDLIQELNS